VSRWEIVALSINDVIGSGVYLLPAGAAAYLGGASTWAVLAAGLAVLLIVLCFAEAASLFDEPGSAYVYTRAAFGDLVGFQVGWLTWISRVASVASLSAGFAQALGAIWPAARAGAAHVLVIVLLLGALAAINVIGVKAGARASVAFTIAKIVPLVAFIAVGITAITPARLFSMPTPTAHGMREAALLLLFAYAGFENTAAAAGEFQNPRRDVPFALLAQIAIVTVLYTLVQLVAVGVLADPAHSESPLADAMQMLVGPAGAILLTFGALVSIVGTNSNTILAGPRYLYAIASTGALPKLLTAIHPRFRTPWIAILVQCGIALPLALSGTFTQLAALSVVARLATYLGTASAVIVLRTKLPRTERTLRLPLGPAIPIAAIVLCVLFLTAATWINLLAGAVALAIGGVLWAVRRRGR